MPMPPEPWMRGTHEDLDVVRRAVVHAFELATEDIAKWCKGLSDKEIFARPHGLPSTAFHLRHIARSLDRLLTYAEGMPLSEAQLASLSSEMAEGTAAGVIAEVFEGLHLAGVRVEAFTPDELTQPRHIGRKRFPSTVGGILIHCAEHTQRHVGQAITTTKVVRGDL